MPRKGMIPKREIVPDPVYQSVLVQKCINSIMSKGKKTVAQGVFYGAMSIIKEKTDEEPVKVFKKAVDNVKPHLEVKSRRVGGSTYQVPIEVSPNRRTALALRWLLGFARSRGGRSMRERFADELLDAANGRGASIKKREDTHRMAEANKAFAHYRW